MENLMLDYQYEFSEYRAGRKPRPNPFIRDERGGVRSMIGITALIQTDPDLAKRLCQEAGERLETWFPNNPL
jgi:hypothetical protein